ncbi:MAG TPA: hypothetical protein VNK82_14360 [Terriglobales bacterium]|nr:hypothetical protein [Terriglobales bacterium]
MSSVRTLGLFFLLSFLLAGCDTSTFCFISTLSASPATATIFVGSSQKFIASGSTTTVACTIQSDPDPATAVVWSVSDPVNVSISNTPGATFGTATCLGPTSGAVTVTATLPAEANAGRKLTATSTLTCK